MTDDGVLILCPYCARGYAWRYDAGNRRVMCHCGAVFRVPLDRYSACELVSKPGDTLTDNPTPPRPDNPSDQPAKQMDDQSGDQLALVEEPIAPVGFLQSINLGEAEPDEELELDDSEMEAGNDSNTPELPPARPGIPPPNHPPTATIPGVEPQAGSENPSDRPVEKPRRPMIMSFEDAVATDLKAQQAAAKPAIPADEAHAGPHEQPMRKPKPQQQRRPEPVKPSTPPPETTAQTQPGTQQTCPHCQGHVPVGVERCPFCSTLLVPVDEKAVAQALESAEESELMRILRKRGMEHVVKNVAREAAERTALEQKHAREQLYYDLLVPGGAAVGGLTLMLFTGLMALTHSDIKTVFITHLFWVVLIIAPSVSGTVLIGQATIDADFHIERIPVVKLAGLILGPWGVAAVCIPDIYPTPDVLSTVMLVLISGLILNALIGVVYRIKLLQASGLMLAYFVLAFLCMTMLARPFAKTMGLLP